MIISKTSETPRCINCGHHSEDPASLARCALFISAVNGQDALCCDVRDDENKCGAEGKLYERRQNVEAYVEQAPIYTYRTAGADPKPAPPVGNKYSEDDVDLQRHIQSQQLPETLKPFTDYKNSNK